MIKAGAAVAVAYGMSAMTLNMIDIYKKIYSEVKTNGMSYNEDLRDYVVEISAILDKYVTLMKSKRRGNTLVQLEKLRKNFRASKDIKEYAFTILSLMNRMQIRWANVLYLIRIPHGELGNAEAVEEIIADRNRLKNNFMLLLESILARQLLLEKRCPNIKPSTLKMIPCNITPNPEIYLKMLSSAQSLKCLTALTFSLEYPSRNLSWISSSPSTWRSPKTMEEWP
jgi:hypothetical protein